MAGAPPDGTQKGTVQFPRQWRQKKERHQFLVMEGLVSVRQVGIVQPECETGGRG